MCIDVLTTSHVATQYTAIYMPIFTFLTTSHDSASFEVMFNVVNMMFVWCEPIFTCCIKSLCQQHTKSVGPCMLQVNLVCLQDVYILAAAVCAPERAREHWAFLTQSAHAHDSDLCHQMLLALFAIQCTLHPKLGGTDNAVKAFLEENGISAVKQTIGTHDILRPHKKRKSHKSKHKKRKSKKRRGHWGDTDSDGSLDDIDLGIMSDSDMTEAKQANQLWQIKAPGLFEMQVCSEDLPVVLLYQALRNWLSFCS